MGMKEYQATDAGTNIISSIQISLVDKSDKWHAVIKIQWSTMGMITSFE